MIIFKIIFVMLHLFGLMCFSDCAPTYNFVIYPERNPQYVYNPQPRPFGSIGDWITSSSWFPIEINVPDAISNIAGSISGITGPITSGISSITGMAQRLPFINRIISSERPRPLQYFILIPNQGDKVMKPLNEFNPFMSATEDFPHYP